jgi:hypothetical protein
MGTKIATADRALTPSGMSNVAEDEPPSWGVADRLLMAFAGFIALVSALSGLALLVVSARASFQ